MDGSLVLEEIFVKTRSVTELGRKVVACKGGG